MHRELLCIDKEAERYIKNLKQTCLDGAKYNIACLTKRYPNFAPKLTEYSNIVIDQYCETVTGQIMNILKCKRQQLFTSDAHYAAWFDAIFAYPAIRKGYGITIMPTMHTYKISPELLQEIDQNNQSSPFRTTN